MKTVIWILKLGPCRSNLSQISISTNKHFSSKINPQCAVPINEDANWVIKDYV